MSQEKQANDAGQVQKRKLVASVDRIRSIATREQMASDGGSSGRSDTNDNTPTSNDGNNSK